MLWQIKNHFDFVFFVLCVNNILFFYKLIMDFRARIIDLVKEGKNNREIADQLRLEFARPVATRTISSLLEKLKIHPACIKPLGFHLCFENGVEVIGLEKIEESKPSKYMGVLKFPKKPNKKARIVINFFKNIINKCGNLKKRENVFVKEYIFYIPENKINLWKEQCYEIRKFLFKNNYCVMGHGVGIGRWVALDGMVEDLKRRISEKSNNTIYMSKY